VCSSDLLCPTCSGTWIAALLTYALYLFPIYTRPFLAIMSASGLSQFSDAILSLVYTDRDLLRDEEDVLKRRKGEGRYREPGKGQGLDSSQQPDHKSQPGDVEVTPRRVAP